MIAELGHYALVLALSLSLVQSIVPFWGARTGDTALMQAGTTCAIAGFLATLIAFAALTYSYVTSDFSLLNVWQNSHTSKPLLYKYTAVWGNHEGSMLLWVLMLTLFSALLAAFATALPARLKANTLSVQGWVTVAFLLFLLFTSNPFERLPQPALQGKDLNPILQDIGLAIHPPLLYVGYVGFSLTFSFAMAAMISGHIDAAWAKYVRPWALLAWVFLTAGIAMGSYWAYYELGWGGWWFWDPVENASFMPWLVGTAFIHSALVMEKREALKIWTILLALLTFSLSLLGTFIVRSGVLTSVHSFATDPTRGVFILTILLIFIGGSLCLFAVRANSLQQGGLFQPVSREGALVFNNLFMTVAAATVVFGTLYPLAVEAWDGSKISVGPPYFNLTFGPLMIPVLMAIPLGPLMSWKRSDLLPVLTRLYFVAGAALLTVVLTAAFTRGGPVIASLMIGLAVWVMLGAMAEIVQRSGLPRVPLSTAVARLRGLPRSVWGTMFAHFGIGVMVLGIVGATVFSSEEAALVRKGETLEIAGFELVHAGNHNRQGSNFIEDALVVDVRKGGRKIAELAPAKRMYTAHGSATTEAAIKSYGFSQLYLSVGDTDEAGRTVLRAWWKSQVILVWLGPILMAFGGLLSLSDRRLRIGIPKASKAGKKLANA
ncbi:MAG: heme lyase CcmF/NrfE family subunit [Rhizobiaceae bacterium]|nr:heme lyase CcmF/NrfE family subunit [Rhizobiaceae bacterium]